MLFSTGIAPLITDLMIRYPNAEAVGFNLPGIGIAIFVGLLIGWRAEKGYRLLKGKQGKAKVVILILAILAGVLLGTVGGDALTVAQMIGSGELPGFVMADIPWFLATMWAESPEYRSGMISNIGMGLLFAALGVWAILRKAGKEVATLTLP